MEKEISNKIFYAGVALGVSLIIGSLIGSIAFYNVKQLDNTLSVTGSAKQKVTSDIVKWRGSFSRTVPTYSLNAGYIQMKNDQSIILKFLADNGIQGKDVTISQVYLEQQYKYDPNAPKEYSLRQTIELQSGDIDKITNLAKNTQKLIEAGVVFSTDSLEYYYSKLPDLRVSLLSEAIKDAKVRSDRIAESSGKKTGSIKSASMGVVQVLSVNSVEISDYGSYDTSSIEKEVMVTVKALFVLK